MIPAQDCIHLKSVCCTRGCQAVLWLPLVLWALTWSSQRGGPSTCWPWHAAGYQRWSMRLCQVRKQQRQASRVCIGHSSEWCICISAQAGLMVAEVAVALTNVMSMMGFLCCCAAVSSDEERAALFMRLWTLKEAFVKCRCGGQLTADRIRDLGFRVGCEFNRQTSAHVSSLGLRRCVCCCCCVGV